MSCLQKVLVVTFLTPPKKGKKFISLTSIALICLTASVPLQPMILTYTGKAGKERQENRYLCCV